VKILKIEHLGLACRSSEAAAKFYSEVLGLPVVERENHADKKLKVLKVGAGESVLELLEPLEGEPVISKFLGSHGEGIHHLCLEVEDIREAIRELKEKGCHPLWDEPKVGAGGKWVTFLRPKETFGVLLELNQDRQKHSPQSPTGG
jgi:methylmalonyl-CoA/ethylmalonyl-CoA epimerase